MRIRATTVLYVLVAAGAAVLLLRSCGGEEKRVRQRLDALRETIEKDGEEGGLTLARRAERFADFFADGFRVAVEPYGLAIEDRRELMRAFVSYRAGPRRIDARYRDLELELGPAGRIATATVVASLVARWPDRSGSEAYRLELRLVDDGEWRIQELSVVEVLEGPDRFF